MVKQDDLKEFVGVRKMVRLTRKVSEGTFHNSGYILGLSENLVLLHGFNDFHIDGYCIYRLGDISSVRSNEMDRKWDQMLCDEGVLDNVGISYDVPLLDFPSVIRGLKAQGRNIIVDCEDCSDAPETGFHIGHIVFYKKQHFEMREFDTTGKWYSHPFEIRHDKVTRVEFDSPYVNIYSKYAE